MRSKRPWKKYAYIDRIETNGGDVQFQPYRAADNEEIQGRGSLGKPMNGERTWNFESFESLTEAEAILDSWWSDWWPKQVKRTRRA